MTVSINKVTGIHVDRSQSIFRRDISKPQKYLQHFCKMHAVFGYTHVCQTHVNSHIIFRAMVNSREAGRGTEPENFLTLCKYVKMLTFFHSFIWV